MNIEKLIECGSDCLVVVSAADLKEFGLSLIDEASALKNQPVKEEFLGVDDACRLLGVSYNSLWRWGKIGYLKSVKVGRKPMYKLSDINKLRGGE